MSRVALVTAYNGQGQLLVGKRNDTGKYTLPAGRLEGDEDPRHAAARELFEETGLRAQSLSYLKRYALSDGTELNCFSAFVTGTPHGKNDPDREVTDWEWVDVEEGLPPKVYNNLAGPRDEQNLVTQLFDLKKAEPVSEPTIIMVRHGATALNDPKNERLRGWSDPPLSDVGLGQASQAAAELRDVPLVAAYCSDLQRACVTAHTVAEPHGIPVEVDHDLRPWDQGDMTGRSVQEYVPVMLEYIQFRPDERIAGSCESFNEFKARFLGALNKYAEVAKSAGGPILLVAHSRNVRMLRGWALQGGGNDVDLAPLIEKEDPVQPGSFMTVKFRDGHWYEDVGEEDLGKAQDEVYRLLGHPDPVERNLALKLDSARGEHVLHAALDPDPAVHVNAVLHPKFGPSEAAFLMEAAAGNDGAYPAAQKTAFLSGPGRPEPHHFTALARAARAAGPEHYDAAVAQVAVHPAAPQGLLRSMYLDPNVIQDSRMAILSHPSAPADVLDHAVASGLTFQGGTAGAAAASAAAHASLPLATLQSVVQRAADRGEPHVVTIAATALAANPGISAPALADLFKDLLPKAVTKPTSAAPQLLAALLRNPSASPALAAEASKALPPETLQHMLGTPHLRGIDLDTLVVHAHRTKNAGLLSRVMEHPDFGARHLGLMLQKAEEDLLKPNAPPMQKLASHPVINYQLGFEPANHVAFRAARFLACRAPVSPEQERSALYAEDGDVTRAALLAYGLPATEENLKSLAAVVDLAEVKKAEDVPEPDPTAEKVVTAHPEAEDVADAVRRAFKDQFVFPVALGGKHSKGSIIAYDQQTKTTLLLKSGSGGAGGAAGSKQDSSNPNAREAAFYYVAKDWKIGEWFPRAELVLVDGRPFAALQLLALDFTTLDYRERKEPGTARQILHPYLYDGILHQWAFIDAVLGQPDRHGNNVMVNPKGDVRLIDEGSAFAGPAFDPAHDQNSFVPYYLRAWALKDNFVKMPVQDKLKALPRVSESVARKLLAWCGGIDESVLEAICVRYGINPEPTLDRLRRLKEAVLVYPFDLAVNRFWVET